MRVRDWIPRESDLTLSERVFFRETAGQKILDIVALYRGTFPCSDRPDAAITANADLIRALMEAPVPPPRPSRRPCRVEVPAGALTLTFTHTKQGISRFVVSSTRGRFPLYRKDNGVAFPVSWARIGSRNPEDPATILDLWRERLENAKANLPAFEALWVEWGLPRSPREISADAPQLDAWRASPPAALIADLDALTGTTSACFPLHGIWDTARVFRMGLLGQVETLLQEIDVGGDLPVAPGDPALPEEVPVAVIPPHVETFVADFGGVLVRYRAVEVIPKAGCGRAIRDGDQHYLHRVGKEGFSPRG
ncbi:MAG: hypothetical protein BWY88_00689 [Synergistetes bacterium ADurb.Bin520]|nr:MAG: hypothetical protein BWY88_00689 [Synergistetes bacterium ADurb.Bin520]